MASNYYRQKIIRLKTRFSPLIGINRRIALPLLEVRPIYLEEAFRTIEEQYGFYRLYSTFGLAGPRREYRKEWLNRWAQRSSIETQMGWIFGDLYEAGRIEARKRLILDIKYQYYPRWLDEFALFVRYYRGQDYYNIRFTNTLSNVSLGITSNTTKLQEAVRFLGEKR